MIGLFAQARRGGESVGRSKLLSSTSAQAASKGTQSQTCAMATQQKASLRKEKGRNEGASRQTCVEDISESNQLINQQAHSSRHRQC